MLIALDNEEQSLRVAQWMMEHYPQVQLVVRAHNRFSVELFRRLGVRTVLRELSESSLLAANRVLREYGFSDVAAQRMVEIFRRHDEESLEKSIELKGNMEALIDHTRNSRGYLATLFQQDREEINRTGN